MMNASDSGHASSAICFAADKIKEAWQQAAYDVVRPSVLWKPRVYIDGSQWCALYGENLQDGVAGFGDSPASAMYDFDRAWHTKLSLPQEKTND